MKNIRVAVIGSRTFDDYNFAKQKINEIVVDYRGDISSIVSGGAKGADKIAEKFASEYNIPMQIFKPDWSIGRHAGFLRNTEIINNSDIVIAFWNGTSTGTKDSINKAYKLSKIVHIILIDN
jgi:hypothetical protein